MEMGALLADGMQTILMKLSLISAPRFRIWVLAPSTAEMSCMVSWIKNVRGSYNRHIMSSVSVKSDRLGWTFWITFQYLGHNAQHA